MARPEVTGRAPTGSPGSDSGATAVVRIQFRSFAMPYRIQRAHYYNLTPRSGSRRELMEPVLSLSPRTTQLGGVASARKPGRV